MAGERQRREERWNFEKRAEQRNAVRLFSLLLSLSLFLPLRALSLFLAPSRARALVFLLLIKMSPVGIVFDYFFLATGSVSLGFLLQLVLF